MFYIMDAYGVLNLYPAEFEHMRSLLDQCPLYDKVEKDNSIPLYVLKG